MPQKTLRIVTYGGLGDILLTTPAIKALKKKYPFSKIIIYGLSRSYMEIFENNPYVNKVRSTSFFANPIAYMLHRFRWAQFHTFHFGRLYPNIFYKKSAVDIIGDVFNVEIQDRKVLLFLTPAEENKAKAMLSAYNNPVILHIASMTSINQEWPLENWEALVEAMPQYTFIQLGLPTEEKVRNAIDLRGKTSFREAFALIKHAKGFAGVNSSLSHVTNAFDIPGVVLFGPSPPVIWGHANNINIYNPPRCAPCVDLLFKEKCPYGRTCMTNITVEEVKEALVRQLSKEQYEHA
jgi:ADP-heptose:LPS heptosyltransferase